MKTRRYTETLQRGPCWHMLGMLIFPKFGEGVPKWDKALVVSEFPQVWVYKAIRYLLRFCSSFEFNFWLPSFERGVLIGVNDGTVGFQKLETDKIALIDG